MCPFVMIFGLAAVVLCDAAEDLFCSVEEQPLEGRVFADGDARKCWLFTSLFTSKEELQNINICSVRQVVWGAFPPIRLELSFDLSVEAMNM